jgi:S-DNA-T family DNA segregation ATPase FtsK/SpoIIIE
MRKMLEYQADRIEAVLAQHRVPGRVTGGVVTPRWVRFKVLPQLGARISAIKRLSEELATAQATMLADLRRFSILCGSLGD